MPTTVAGMAAALLLACGSGNGGAASGQPAVDANGADDPIPYVAVPLVPEGITAARAFLHARAFGPWSRGSANKALRAAARRAGRPPFTVYQIRHSFAAGLRRAGTDVADIQDLYGHTSSLWQKAPLHALPLGATPRTPGGC